MNTHIMYLYRIYTHVDYMVFIDLCSPKPPPPRPNLENLVINRWVSIRAVLVPR